MTKRRAMTFLAMAVLALSTGCTTEETGGGGAAGVGNAGTAAGTTAGATAGVMAGATAGVTAGVTGGEAGVSAGVTAGTVSGQGGVAGVMAGEGGEAGTIAGEGGMGGEAGVMAGEGGMGAGPVTDYASCVAAAEANGRGGPCAECGCMNCLAAILDCQDDACNSVVQCGQAAGCSGRGCYCGDIEVITCAITGAQGPCMNEIAEASGLVANMTCASNALCASPINELATTDPTNPVQRARALSVCTQGQRFAAGSLLVAEVPEIMGMCEAQCNTQ